MTYTMEISNASQQSEWCDRSDGTKFIKLQRCLWSYQWSEPRQPRQDERGGPWGAGHAGTAGHWGHDGAPHLQGRDITQVGTRTDIVKWSSLTFHESYRDIDSALIWSIKSKPRYSRHVWREGLSASRHAVGQAGVWRLFYKREPESRKII